MKMGEDRNQWCFACGPLNPIGLKLKFRHEGDTYVTTFTAGPEHQSYDGIVHGGILSTLLDESMVRYLHEQGLKAVTARLELRYRQQVPIGQELRVISRVVSHKRNIYELAGEIYLPNGEVAVEGKATAFIIKEV